MSFFRGHRSHQTYQAGDAASAIDLPARAAASTPTDGDGTSLMSKSSPRGRRVLALSLLSSKLSPRLFKRAPATRHGAFGAPVGHTVDFPGSFSRESTPSPTPSEDDIRMPAGLGRRASASSACEEPPWPQLTDVDANRRTRSISSPNATPSRPHAMNGALAAVREEQRPGIHTGLARIPEELLEVIVSFVSRPDIVSLALTSRPFSKVALRTLYQELDIWGMKVERAHACVALLASKRSLAGLVRHFACSTLPSLRVPPMPSAVITYAAAFNNMDRLQSLVIPFFEAPVFQHTTFSLNRLTIHSRIISADEYGEMLSWLSKQPEITSLSLPHLSLGRVIDDSVREAGDGPLLKNDISSLSHSLPSRFLPRLTHLDASVDISTLLIPDRPVATAVLNIDHDLYHGLKPSAVMSALARSSAHVTHLTIAPASEWVDARSLERVLMSAGAELGERLEVLQVQWLLREEVLYKQILAVISRFRALRTLRLYRAGPGLQSPPIGLPTPPPSAHLDSPSSALLALPSTGYGSRPSTANSISSIPLPRTHERAHLGSWSKHCPTLKEVVFLSGARWRSERVSSLMMAGDSLYAPAFRFVGLAS